MNAHQRRVFRRRCQRTVVKGIMHINHRAEKLLNDIAHKYFATDNWREWGVVVEQENSVLLGSKE